MAREAKRKQYERQGHVLQTAAEVDQELVAEYVSKYLLTDEASIVSLVKQDRTLGQRIKDWFDGILAKLGNKNAQERAFLVRARDIYAKALRQTQGQKQVQAAASGTETAAAKGVSAVNDPDPEVAEGMRQVEEAYARGEIGDAEYDQIMDEYERWQEERRTAGERKYSFAGEKAKTADLPALLNAVQLAQQGADPEAIRRETGWFKGADGKWRFEIDDSSMRYHRAGDALFSEMHPDYTRHQELERKLLYGELTGTEEQEYRKLNEVWGNERQRLSDRVRRGNATLQNVLQHDALFEAYPELRGAKVVFTEMEAGERGSYNPNNNTITISESLRRAPEGTLLHEIQHAIQHVEGFTPGANEAYWKSRRAGIIETISGARKNLDLWLEDIGYPEYRDKSLREVVKREKTLDQHWRDMEEFKANSEYARQIAACEAELAEFQRQYDEITGGMTPSEQYFNTAGEIEARDAAKRRSMTADERKNSPPDLGDENTVFAESSGISLDRDISEYPYDMQTVIREYLDAVDPDVLAFVSEVHEGKAWKGKKIAVGEADERLSSDVHSALGIDVEVGSRILLTTNAVEHIEKRHGENGVHDQSMKNPNDLARIKFVIQNYDNVEDGRKASGEYKNSDGTRARTVVLSKKINGTYFVVEAVPDTGKVGIVSAYISKKGTSQVPDASTPSRDAQNELASVPKKKVPQQSRDVKQKFSLSDDTVSKKDVARELHAILQRGGDIQELKRYVAQLERSGGKAEQKSASAEQTRSEAEQIVRKAKQQGVSVEQYLQENAYQQLSAKGSGASLAQSISTADIKSVADLFAVVKQHDANFKPTLKQE